MIETTFKILDFSKRKDRFDVRNLEFAKDMIWLEELLAVSGCQKAISDSSLDEISELMMKLGPQPDINPENIEHLANIMINFVGNLSVFEDELMSCSIVPDASWRTLNFNVNLMKFIGFTTSSLAQIGTDKEKISHKIQWDFIFCNLLGWCQSLSESSQIWLDEEDPIESLIFLKLVRFTKACCDLVSAVSRLFCTRCCLSSMKTDEYDREEMNSMKVPESTPFHPWIKKEKKETDVIMGGYISR